MMKCFRVALLLCLSLLLTVSLCACGYKPVASTAEEGRAVFFLDGTHEVKYELFRFVFLQKKQAESDGNEEYFANKNKTELFERYAEEAEAEAAKVYAMFSLCSKYGIDPYSEEIEEEITETLKQTIKGDDATPGYGSQKAYLEDIKSQFLNDSVYRLYLRYDVCERRLAAKLKQDDIIQAKWEDVFSYYNGEETVRDTWILIPYSNLEGYTAGMKQTLWAEASEKSNADFTSMAAQYATIQSAEEMATGIYFGKYEYDTLYKELVDTAFSLAEGETSEPFYSGDGLYIVRRLPKDVQYLADESNRDLLNEGYMLNAFGQMLAEEELRLLDAISYTDYYATLTFDSIKMSD